MISLDLTTFVLQLINFMVLYFVLKRFLFGPITNLMNDRSEKISDQIDQAIERENEAEQLKAEYQQRLQDAKAEAQDIIEDSRRRAQRNKEDLINEAKSEANQKIERAEQEISRAKQQAVESLKDEVTNISIQMTKQLLEKSINTELQEKTIESYIEGIDKDKLGELGC
ncbi:ATP synthase F0 subcomplex B subunit [Orenia metallireducens]|uniref:ATP synthase subunit b n=1 Tax=Orenia metallireducens TaxID=1413210 RepID=A0A285GLS3_9FIRM|nr:F0F1 ATP synthase subunit B [Orenia metallireducens]PRX35761.1 ATP synthase F0 subcomplex B subunit [Orenia metallireducens]SNY24154.1 ATP synthase F0 subcomplex B subunit [Orenia metallireducens]